MTHRPDLYPKATPDKQFAHDVVRRLVEGGYIAYFAGGCVRDAILGNDPHDFDVATNATTDQVRSVFGPNQTRAVGEAFGVVLVHGKSHGRKCQVEVATFRSDGAYSDGRRPDWVVFTSPENDAQRRDFTINGLFYDPIEERIIDYVGGREDLERRVLRAIGNPEARIREDKLRMLRAIRFAARFGFALDPTTQQAIVRNAEQIQAVSGERTGVELTKILEHPSRHWAWEKLFETGLTQYVIPELHSRWSIANHREEDLSLLRQLPETPVPFPVSLAAILYPWFRDISGGREELESMSLAIQERWKLANVEIETIQFAIQNAEVLIQGSTLPWSQVQPVLTSRFIETALALAEAIAMLRTDSLHGIEHCRSTLRSPESVWNPRPFLDGSDLIRAGLKPGPGFATLLASARQMQLDGNLRSKEEAIAWMKTLLDQAG
ncbi:MAG: CCA tRNA nucleotidyltransferase [Pirellula sp.]